MGQTIKHGVTQGDNRYNGNKVANELESFCRTGGR